MQVSSRNIMHVIVAVLLLESVDAQMQMHRNSMLRTLRKIVIATNAVCPRLSADALTNLLKHLMQRDVLFAKHVN